MNCPACGNRKTEVLETRRALTGDDVQRRHECPCGVRWVSIQKLVRGSLHAVPPDKPKHENPTGRLPVVAPAPTRTLPAAAPEGPQQASSEAQPLLGGLGGSVPVPSGLDSVPESDPILSQPPDQRDVDIMSVFAHYRRHHPRALPKPTRASKEWRLVRDRLKDGHSVADLRDAIDGYHSSPWHCGENDRHTKFLDLTLLLRDSSHVQRGIELLAQGGRPRSRNGAAVEGWVASRKEAEDATQR